MSKITASNFRPSLGGLPKLVGVAIAYALIAKTVLGFFSINGIVSIIWPPSGLAVAALLLGGKKYWPTIFAGALFGNVMAGTPVMESCFIAIGNMLEALVCIHLLEYRRNFDPTFNRLHDYWKLVLSGAAGSCISALLGCTTLLLANFLNWDALPGNLLTWWQGDFLGIVLFTPLIMVCFRSPHDQFHAKLSFESATFFALAFLVGQIVFLGWLHDWVGHIPRGFWMFPFVVWAAVRFGPQSVLFVIVMFGTQALIGAASHTGFFGADMVDTKLMNFWFFMLILTMVGVPLAVLFSERLQIQNDMHVKTEDLERAVNTLKNAEMEIRQNQERMETAASAGIVGIWEWDVVNNKVSWDEVNYRLYGIRAEDFGSAFEAWSTCIHPEDRAYAEGEVYAALRGEREHMSEFRVIWPDGSIHHLKTVSKTTIDDQGQPLRMLGVSYDITEQKVAEKKLMDSKLLLESIIENIPHVIFLKRATDLCFEMFNHAGETLLGRNRLEILGRNDYDFFPKEQADFFTAQDRLALQQDKVTDFPEEDLDTPRGKRILHTKKLALKDEHGQPAYLLGISEDITERKQAELNLQESESRLSALFDTKAISIVVIDKWGIIERFNAASEVMFGYSSAEVVGRNVNVLMPEPYHSEHDAYVKHYVESGERRVIGIGREVVGRRKDGATFLMELLVGDTGTGGDHSFIGFCQDITERKRLAAAGKLFELVVRSSDDAIVTQQLDGTITSWNPGAEALFGYPAGEMIGRSVLKLFPPDRLDEEFAIQVKIRRREQVKHLETIRVRKDGSLFDVSLTLSPILDDNGTVVGISKIVRDISERKKSDNAIHNLAFYDPLTELPNRRLFYDRLTIALSVSARTEQYGALMFLDLDNFKALNDSQGHDAGDQLLVEVANRLKSCVREVDTVARLGGDEFVVLIENLGSDENDASQTVAHVAEKIRESLATPYEIRQTSHHSTPSIGVYVFLGDIDVVDDVIKRADIAMYQAKDSGRNSVRFYNPELQKLVQDRASLESDLLEGIESQQLQLYYQIQVDNELRPFGAEALIRWNHPVRGLVSPVVFIPVAEESTLILDIGYWVLDNACQQISAWSKHKHTSELILAVNVSAKQFRQLDFVEIVKSLIDKHHINPSRLKLELTESVALNDLDFVIAKMQALREVLGVKLSLDDFGTGYSSLSYLKRLPLHQVKIDQSFVRDMVTDASDDLLVKTIIDMAHNFNLDVIAEGVETEAQLTRLGEHGCTSYQGYLFSKPVPVAEFEKLLNESPIQVC